MIKKTIVALFNFSAAMGLVIFALVHLAPKSMGLQEDTPVNPITCKLVLDELGIKDSSDCKVTLLDIPVHGYYSTHEAYAVKYSNGLVARVYLVDSGVYKIRVKDVSFDEIPKEWSK